MKNFFYAAFILSLAANGLSGCSNAPQAKNPIEIPSQSSSVVSGRTHTWDISGHMAD